MKFQIRTLVTGLALAASAVITLAGALRPGMLPSFAPTLAPLPALPVSAAAPKPGRIASGVWWPVPQSRFAPVRPNPARSPRQRRAAIASGVWWPVPQAAFTPAQPASKCARRNG